MTQSRLAKPIGICICSFCTDWTWLLQPAEGSGCIARFWIRTDCGRGSGMLQYVQPPSLISILQAAIPKTSFESASTGQPHLSQSCDLTERHAMPGIVEVKKSLDFAGVFSQTAVSAVQAKDAPVKRDKLP